MLTALVSGLLTTYIFRPSHLALEYTMNRHFSRQSHTHTHTYTYIYSILISNIINIFKCSYLIYKSLGRFFMIQLSPQTGRERTCSEDFLLAGFWRWELIKPDIWIMSFKHIFYSAHIPNFYKRGTFWQRKTEWMVFNQDPVSLEWNLTRNHPEMQTELSVDCEVQASTLAPPHTELDQVVQRKRGHT